MEQGRRATGRTYPEAWGKAQEKSTGSDGGGACDEPGTDRTG